MAWVETSSLSFTARYEARQSEVVLSALEELESYRDRLESLFPRTPGNVTIVLHDSPLQLAIAQPYLAFARRLASPAARRYMVSWFTQGEVHTLAPDVLRKLATGPGSRTAKYRQLFERIKASFNRAYVSEEGRIKGDTQTGYVLALAFDLLDADRQKLAAQHLIENIEARGGHLSTGFIGTKDLMLALSRIGRHDVAYRLLHTDTFPSWGFSIKHGATSIWERWDGWTPEKGFQDPGMNSFAHYSFGAVYQWMVENIGGIRSEGPGYKKIVIAPQLDSRLTWAETAYDSIRGRIESRWERQKGQLQVTVTIPANTTATVQLPAPSATDITEGGRPLAEADGVKFLRHEGNCAYLAVSPGTYRFASPIAVPAQGAKP